MNIKKINTLKMLPQEYNVIFWDFDGVIKESVTVKIDGFKSLFFEYGADVIEKIISHNQLNGGVSRYKKIPYYFKEYVGIQLTEKQIEIECKRLSELTNEAVINSPWVAGVKDFLFKGYKKQKYYIVTGTPQTDIDFIVNRLNIREYFNGIYGSPRTKPDIISALMNKYNYSYKECLLIGDSMTDYESAKENHIDFLLRSTSINHEQFKKINCPKFNDFEEINGIN
jgi:HAD superfamily hydrolase (TIGR01549 family)